MSELKCREAIKNISGYSPAKSVEEIKKELGLDSIIKLAANETTMGCSPLAEKAIQEAIKDVYLYPDGYARKLRRKLAEINNIKEEQLIFGNGSFELLSLIAQTFINDGDECIIPEPTFKWYNVVTLTMGGTVVSLPLKNYTIDLGEVENRITEKTKILWLCNPNNPTGTIFGQTALENFLGRISKDIIVVLDEAYYEYNSSLDYPDSIALLDKHPNVIILRTFSKIYGLAALRVGYGIGNPELISYINRIRIPSNVNRIAQTAALASLNDEDFKNKVLDNNNKGKEYYYEFFKEMNLEYIPTETNFIMVNVERDATFVANEILKRGISLRPGKEFGMPTWLRITIGTYEENKLVVKNLKEVLFG